MSDRHEVPAADVPLAQAVAAAPTREGAGPWRWRQREWAWLSATFSLLCLLFTAWPELDLQAAAPFFRAGSGADGRFPIGQWDIVRAIYVVVPWLGRLAALAGLIVAVFFWRRPGVIGVRWWRRTMVLGLSMALGTGLLVNGVLKEHWGRSRPNTAQAFEGSLPFAPALKPSNQCETNCSFVSGHSATGFTVMAVGLLGAPATRRRWLLAGAGCGLIVGLVRMAQGGHYLSDVLFSGIAVWLCNLCLTEVWIRVKARRRRTLRAATSRRG